MQELLQSMDVARLFEGLFAFSWQQAVMLLVGIGDLAGCREGI